MMLSLEAPKGQLRCHVGSSPAGGVSGAERRPTSLPLTESRPSTHAACTVRRAAARRSRDWGGSARASVCRDKRTSRRVQAGQTERASAKSSTLRRRTLEQPALGIHHVLVLPLPAGVRAHLRRHHQRRLAAFTLTALYWIIIRTAAAAAHAGGEVRVAAQSGANGVHVHGPKISAGHARLQEPLEVIGALAAGILAPVVTLGHRGRGERRTAFELRPPRACGTSQIEYTAAHSEQPLGRCRDAALRPPLPRHSLLRLRATTVLLLLASTRPVSRCLSSAPRSATAYRAAAESSRSSDVRRRGWKRCPARRASAGGAPAPPGPRRAAGLRSPEHRLLQRRVLAALAEREPARSGPAVRRAALGRCAGRLLGSVTAQQTSAAGRGGDACARRSRAAERGAEPPWPEGRLSLCSPRRSRSPVCGRSLRTPACSRSLVNYTLHNQT